MNIAGLQKLTLLDYPGKVACTVFLAGCNFRCPYCHNSGLLGTAGEPYMTQPQLLEYLQKRRGLLDGVCVTGGEPTLYAHLPQLCQRIKALGFLVKLDTNGSSPERLMELVRAGLVDYVAMDIKNSPGRYGDTTLWPRDLLPQVERSIRFLLQGSVEYEFRTTVTAQHHSPEAMEQMGAWLNSLGPKPGKLFLQPYVHRDSVLQEGLSAPDKGQLLAMRSALAPYVHSVCIRGETMDN